MKKISVIGDLINSKKIIDRNGIQQKLQSGINLVNRGNPNLQAPYKIILGDEFQAVYNNADSIFFDMLRIAESVFPQKIRFSIGIGEITALFSDNSVEGMDGPAFYAARDGMTIVKKSNSLFYLNSVIKENKLINHTLTLVSEEIKSWNENRLKVFVMNCLNYDINRIAAELNLSKRAVYKTIKDGSIPVISDTFKEIGLIINENLN